MRSCCCLLQCVHYSMERGDAELISMATGVEWQDTGDGESPARIRSLPGGCMCSTLRLSGDAMVRRVREATLAAVASKRRLPARALSDAFRGETADVRGSGSGCRQDGGCFDRPHVGAEPALPRCGGWCCLTTSRLLAGGYLFGWESFQESSIKHKKP